jgi:hypothetical protein
MFAFTFEYSHAERMRDPRVSVHDHAVMATVEVGRSQELAAGVNEEYSVLNEVDRYPVRPLDDSLVKQDHAVLSVEVSS